MQGGSVPACGRDYQLGGPGDPRFRRCERGGLCFDFGPMAAEPTPLTRRQAIAGLSALALPWPDLLAQTSAPSASPPPAGASLPPDLTRIAPDLPNFHPMMEAIARDHGPRLSFLDPKWSSLDAWKRVARPAFRELLRYAPKAVPLAAETLGREERDGFTVERVSIHATDTYKIPARVLVPTRRRPGERLPAVVAMHCHSGRYVWGHEKVLSSPTDSPTLTAFRDGTYGRAWAEVLARRGYVVIAIDAFYFGERRLAVENLEPSRVFGDVREAFATARKAAPQSPEWVSATNRVCSHYEHHTAKTIFAAGATWPGLHAWDDMRTVDYLATRPEVDASRIGVIGLSGGGFRTALLIAADARIKAASITGWMTQFAHQLKHHARHTWMVWLPGLYNALDLPDAVALHAPGALLVQQCRRDTLYPLSGMESAVEHLQRTYAKAGLAEKFRGTFYDVPHSFRPEMQDEAFEWMDRWL